MLVAAQQPKPNPDKVSRELRQPGEKEENSDPPANSKSNLSNRALLRGLKSHLFLRLGQLKTRIAEAPPFPLKTSKENTVHAAGTHPWGLLSELVLAGVELIFSTGAGMGL